MEKHHEITEPEQFTVQPFVVGRLYEVFYAIFPPLFPTLGYSAVPIYCYILVLV